ncbi:MAG: transposase [Prevotellaceae bacterium]|nr:transposase [Prevotellaceae bacterium]
MDDSGFKSFNVIAAILYAHYDYVLNFFVNRVTNAFAESFNAKIKSFRALLRRVTDIRPFFSGLLNYMLIPYIYLVSHSLVIGIS